MGKKGAEFSLGSCITKNIAGYNTLGVGFEMSTDDGLKALDRDVFTRHGRISSFYG